MLNLRDRRLERNLTMREVALQAGITEAMYSYIENGKRNPSVKKAKILGEILDIDWTEFFEDRSAG